MIDAGRDKLTGVEEYANEKYNVAEFVSAKTGRGPLQNNWIVRWDTKRRRIPNSSRPTRRKTPRP